VQQAIVKIISKMSLAEELTKKVSQATAHTENQQTGNAIKIFEEVIKVEIRAAQINDEVIRAKENATYRLAKILRDKGLVDELISLQKQILPLFIEFPKSKTAKITRSLFDLSLTIDPTSQLGPLGSTQFYAKLVDLSRHIIAWCETESRSFLRMRIETNLADLLFKQEKYADSLEILNRLTYELKKKEDKQLLVESQLVESKVYHALENVSKAKAALTAVKTTANSTYIVPLLQAEIDFMSGLIAADEKDYILAYSYFYETFEGYRSMSDVPRAGMAFKFMLFSKVMNRQSDDALNLINSAISLKYQSTQIDAMKEVALANKH
jgi:26S proteasome regulatory subunit N6